jgi:hypothetical protein
MTDWEDVAVGPCPQGTCVYVADIGDNHANRAEIQIYRMREPHPNDIVSDSVETLRATYPDGPQDAEALFVLSDGALFIVTKGNTGPVALYRFPLPLRTDASLRLERLATVVPSRASGGVPRHQRVTGASASPNGRWVALRTREAITFYAAHELVRGMIRAVFRYDVSDLREPQGEAIALAPGGEVWIAGEGGGKSRPGTLARLACTLP